MFQHARVPHIFFELPQSAFGPIKIHAQCQICGENFDWVCQRGPRLAEWRVDQFANWHTHGVVRKVAFVPMPRG